MNEKDKIVDNIARLSGKYTPYTVFADWVLMLAISIQNACVLIHNKVWEEREELYKNTASKYTDEELKRFVEMGVGSRI